MTFRASHSRPQPPPPKKGKLVAKYGLTEKDSFFSGRADVVIYELVEYQARGFIVEEVYDRRRKVWVYSVYEPEAEPPVQAPPT
jgi:hypothetical protein